MSGTVAAQPSPPTASQQQSKVFDFTKRKKWADLLVNELPGTIMLVLSSSGKVLFHGEAARELLGWKDDVTNSQINGLVHAEDEAAFVTHFNTCLANRTELSIFVRLKNDLTLPNPASTPEWPMYEIKGHPYFLSSNNNDAIDCKCVFATARPYPSRNTEVLDSFIELKMENERLRERLLELRSPNATLFPLNQVFPTSSPTDFPPHMVHSSGISTEPDVMFQRSSIHSLPSSSHSRRPSEATFPLANSSSTIDGGELGGSAAPRHKRNSGGNVEVDEDDATLRRRKRKAQNNEHQYVCVTCGRTDSPEWRKGPLGPKTLCNACGLRHSKRTKKKADDDPEPAPQPQPSQQSQPPQQQQQSTQSPPQISLSPIVREYMPASDYATMNLVTFDNTPSMPQGRGMPPPIQTQFTHSPSDQMSMSSASIHFPMSARGDLYND